MLNLEIYEDRERRVFHYQAYRPGVVGARSVPMVCGRVRYDSDRVVARFPVGDRRGSVHFERACVGCVGGLERMLDDAEE